MTADNENELPAEENINPEPTPKRFGPGTMNGNETGRSFTSTNQPSSEAKSRGQKKRYGLKKLLDITTPGRVGTNQINYAQLAADFYGIEIEDVTIRMIMDFRQIEKSVAKADTAAYEAIMNRAYGKPGQPLTGANNTPLMPIEHKIIHVTSNVPLSDNEEDVDI